LENLYEELEINGRKAEEIKQSLRKKLLGHKEEAFISKTLSEIRFDAPIDFDLKKCRWGEYDKGKVRQIFEKYKFQTLINRLPQSCPTNNNLQLFKGREA
jgi:DNA polymerase-1